MSEASLINHLVSLAGKWASVDCEDAPHRHDSLELGELKLKSPAGMDSASGFVSAARQESFRAQEGRLTHQLSSPWGEALDFLCMPVTPPLAAC